MNKRIKKASKSGFKSAGYYSEEIFNQLIHAIRKTIRTDNDLKNLMPYERFLLIKALAKAKSLE